MNSNTTVTPVNPTKNIKRLEASLVDILSKEPRILKAWLFGSYARDDFESHSDIDLLISYQVNAGFTLFDLAEIQFQLEKTTSRKVDIVPEDGLKPRIRPTILAERILIYEKKQPN